LESNVTFDDRQLIGKANKFAIDLELLESGSAFSQELGTATTANQSRGAFEALQFPNTTEVTRVRDVVQAWGYCDQFGQLKRHWRASPTSSPAG
jgi:hypothetical protein